MNVPALTALLEPVLAAHGLELDRLDVIPAGKRSVLRITVDGDGPLGRGPLLDDVAQASKAVSAALDGSAATGSAPYVLEVTTRGVGQPLTQPRQWKRNSGRLVSVSFPDGTQVTGRIADAGPAAATIEVDGQRREVPYEQVSRAAVQVEMNRKPDPELDDIGDDSDDQNEE